MIESGTIRQRNWMWFEFTIAFISLRTSTYWRSSPSGMQLASKLSGAFPRQGGKRKEGLQLRLWNLNSTSNSPVAPRWLSCQISANHREAETSANVNKHWKTRAKGNDVTIYVISSNHHFASTFSMQIFQLTFLFSPRHQDVRCTTWTKFELQEHSPIPTLAFCMWQLMCPSQNPRPCMLSNRQPRFRKSHIPLDCM